MVCAGYQLLAWGEPIWQWAAPLYGRRVAALGRVAVPRCLGAGVGVAAIVVVAYVVVAVVVVEVAVAVVVSAEQPDAPPEFASCGLLEVAVLVVP